MLKMFSLFVCVFIIDGVFGVEPDEVKTVTEGDSLTLKANFTEMQKDGLIDWRVNGTHIVKINAESGKVDYTNKMFGDRFRADRSGILFMLNVKNKHSGVYEVRSSSSTTKSRTFKVIVEDSPLQSVEDKDAVKSVKATEGLSVTLITDVELQKHDLVLWRIGAKGALIAKADVEDGQILYYGGPDGTFRDRLKMDDKTGSLTISDIRAEDTGEFNVKIINDINTSFKRFIVAVTGVVSRSVMTGDSVILFTGVTEMKRYQMQLKFNDKVIYTSNGAVDLSWRNIDLNNESGNLVITSIQTAQFGDYEVEVKNNGSMVLHEKYHIYSIGWSSGAVAGLVCGVLLLSASGVICFLFYRHKMSELQTHKKERMFVIDGGSIILNPDTDIKGDDEIQWMFGDQDHLIAKSMGKNRGVTYPNERFLNRLELNKETGFLMISKIGIEDSGVYKLKISSSSRGTKTQEFLVINTEALLIMEGEQVLLKYPAEIQRDEQTEWTFSYSAFSIAQLKTGVIPTADGRFKGRLELKETGSLLIKNLKIEDSGLYELKIKSSSSTRETVKAFFVKVTYPDGNQVNSVTEATELLDENERQGTTSF